MAEHNYKFNITMTCGGCSGAVDRVLKKLDGTFLFSCVPRTSFFALPPRPAPCPSVGRRTTKHQHHMTLPTSLYLSLAVSSLLTRCDHGEIGVKTHEVVLGSALGKPAEEGTVKVVAEPTLDYDTVLRTISKTGKKVNSKISN